jgi:hypothetical protein
VTSTDRPQGLSAPSHLGQSTTQDKLVDLDNPIKRRLKMNHGSKPSSKRRSMLKLIFGFGFTSPLLSCGGSGGTTAEKFPFTFSATGSAFTGVLACGYKGAEMETYRNFEYTGNGILNKGSDGTVSANFTVLSNFSAASENCPAFENSATYWTAIGEVAGNSIVCATNNVGGTNFQFRFEKGGGGTVTVAFRDKDHNGTGQGAVTSQWK